MGKRIGFFSGSLKAYVAFIVIALFAGTSAVAFFVFQNIVDETVKAIGIHFAEKQVLFDRARSLQPLVREVALATKLARSPIIRAWAKDEQSSDLKAKGLEELESFRRMFRDKSYFFAISQSGNYYFNDKDGAYTGNEYRYTTSPDNPRDGWFYTTLLMKEECQLNVDRDRGIDVTKVWINCIVVDDSAVVGVIGTGIDLTEFIRTVVDSKQIGVETIFIDKSGAIQAHRDLQQIDFHSLTKRIQDRKTIFQMIDDTAEKKEFSLLLSSLKERGNAVKTMFLTIAEHRYLAGAAYLDEMGWFNVTLMDLDAMVARSYFNYFAELMTGILLVTLLLVMVLFNHFVLNRIYRLERSVRQVSDGKYNGIIPDDRPDEIGRLSVNLKKMAETVGKYTGNLEQEIKKRTKELEAAKEKAVEAARLKDKFVSLVAHDLRAPLWASVGLLEILNSEKHGDNLSSEGTDILKCVISGNKGLIGTLDKLLDVSRLQTGQIVLTKEHMDTCLFVEKNIQPFLHIAEGKGIKIFNKVPKGKMIEIDPALFGQVIQNLVSNAIKFCNSMDEITIFVPDGRPNAIAVKDTGVGIDKEILLDIFKHEVKTTTSGTGGEEGTGLGLPYCRNIMEAHNGLIIAESEKCAGSIFYLEIPKAKH